MRASTSRSRLFHSVLVGFLFCLSALCAGPAMAQVASKPPHSPAVRSPSDTVREFYKAMREKRFREAFDITIYKPAIDPLTPQEFDELRPDFEKMAAVIPLQVDLSGEQVRGDVASVFVKDKEGENK